ncbi:MAG: hypothetical protein GEV12_14420 [Micromonosporaceae bacterium]|nr:hypothetical protein [Micromonosporaceae bacterium]
MTAMHQPPHTSARICTACGGDLLTDVEWNVELCDHCAPKVRRDPGDPGPAAHMDPRVSSIIYELRDRGVRDQAEVVRMLNDRLGAGLVPAQTAAVMSAFRQPLVGPDDKEPPGASWAGNTDWYADH